MSTIHQKNPSQSMQNGSLASQAPEVVIVGAGFGGLYAAHALRQADVQVTIIDRNNYHKFQPLMYQVATAGLQPEDIARNVRDIFARFDHIDFLLDEVTGIDRESQHVQTKSGGDVPYDYLIIAAGAETDFFGVDGAAEFGRSVKNVPDAVELRNHILTQFEEANRLQDGEGGRLNFVVVGGGPTGVEMSGALTELFAIMQADFPKLDTESAQVFLVERNDQLLAGYPAKLAHYAQEVLESRGVKVQLNTAVTKAEEGCVILNEETELPCHTLIWSAGVRAAALAENLPGDKSQSGQVEVSSDLRLPGFDNVFAVGDIAAMQGSGGPYPQLAPVAIQQGKHAARQILRLIEGKETETFKYNDRGQMATIGRNAAVAELANGIQMKGFIAWLAWVFIHIAKLVGFRNRTSVFLNWIYNYFTYDRSARLIWNLDEPKTAPSTRETEE